MLPSTFQKNKDKDVCCGKPVKKVEDKQIKPWACHNISNILYQVECGGRGALFLQSFNTDSKCYHTIQQYIANMQPQKHRVILPKIKRSSLI